MKAVFSKDAPKVVGPYSQAVISGNFVFCSGQIAIDPKTGVLRGDSIEEQTEQVISNLSSVLEEAGSSLDSVVQSSCFLKNMSDYQKFNEIYSKFFDKNRPARYTVGVAALPANALVEISVIAEIS